MIAVNNKTSRISYEKILYYLCLTFIPHRLLCNTDASLILIKQVPIERSSRWNNTTNLTTVSHWISHVDICRILHWIMAVFCCFPSSWKSPPFCWSLWSRFVSSNEATKNDKNMFLARKIKYRQSEIPIKTSTITHAFPPQFSTAIYYLSPMYLLFTM